jgi:hypothetical protein
VGLFGQLLFEVLDADRREVGRLRTVMAFQASQRRTFNGLFDGAQIIQMHPILAQELAEGRIGHTGGQIQFEFAGGR